MQEVSCVIRTFNEAERLERLLQSLSEQDACGARLEVIVVDSGSSDKTCGILKKYGISPVSIPQAEFNYSTALNLGIEHSHGELIVALSGHSVPCSGGWLSGMVSHFTSSRVAGVYCRQIPWPKADLQEVLRLDRAFGPSSTQFTAGRREGMRFSNAASCIRRSVWAQHPFVVMPAAEDVEWATWALDHDYSIVYDADCAVYHSHAESCRKAARRIIEIERSADLTRGRRRTALRTARQSLGWLARDARNLVSTRADAREKLVCLSRTVRKCFWYAVDFNRL